MIDDFLIFLAIVLAWTVPAAALEPYGWCKADGCFHTDRPRFLSRWLLWPKYAKRMWQRKKHPCPKCGELSFEWH